MRNCKCGGKKRKGFTLIELLVVIAIIGLLSTLAVVSLSAARTRARDVKRLADLRNFQSALEIYASEQGTYPKVKEEAINDGDVGCLMGGTAATAEDIFKTTEASCKGSAVLIKVQKDPSGPYFIYQGDETTGATYALWIAEEGKTGVCGTPQGITDDQSCAACLGAAATLCPS